MRGSIVRVRNRPTSSAGDAPYSRSTYGIDFPEAENVATLVRYVAIGSNVHGCSHGTLIYRNSKRSRIGDVATRRG